MVKQSFKAIFIILSIILRKLLYYFPMLFTDREFMRATELTQDFNNYFKD